MKNILLIIIISGFSLHDFAQSDSSHSVARSTQHPSILQPSASRPAADSSLAQAFQFTDSVFNRAEFTYEIVEPDLPADMQSILTRFNNAVAANKEWFLEYRNKNATADQPLPYNARFGITATEYNRLLHLEKAAPHFITIAQQKITVQRQNDHIYFKGNDESRILDYLMIDPQHQAITFVGDTLLFAGAMNVNQRTPFGLSQGYVWRLEKADIPSTLQAGKVTARVVEINLGLTNDASPKIFLLIKYQDMQEGVTRADLDLIGFVH